MGREHIDSRAISLGGLVGAPVIAVPLFLVRGYLIEPYSMLAVLGGVCILAGGLAGGVAGYTSRKGLRPLEEGTIAATLALCLGMTLWIAGQMLLSPLHPADTALILVFNVFVPVALVFPFSMVVGAFAGERALFVTGGV